MDRIADPLATADADWPVNCGGHETLCDVLSKTAIDREVLAAVADSHAPGVYEFVDGIKRLGVENFMVIALDDPCTNASPTTAWRRTGSSTTRGGRTRSPRRSFASSRSLSRGGARFY